MDALVLWGTGVIQWLQSFRSPVLDALFRGSTFLGDERFYLLLIPLLYWVVDKRLAIRLSFVYLGSAYLNTLLKAAFAVPRPSFPAVQVLDQAEGYAFPSGHAQTASTVWSYLAIQAQRTWFWVTAALVILLVALSRVYLGVHYPQDVLVGTLLAFFIVAAYDSFVRRYGARIAQLPLSAKLGLGCAVPLLLLALHAEKDTVSAMAACLGLSTGVALEYEYVRFQCAGSATQHAIRFAIGLIGLLALYLGLSAVLPGGLLFRLLRYALIGLWASLTAPWLFVKLRLAGVETPR
ncbi:MAG: phosphatase PAP2 family protein [Candidatus Hadarchaeum sp.]